MIDFAYVIFNRVCGEYTDKFFSRMVYRILKLLTNTVGVLQLRIQLFYGRKRRKNYEYTEKVIASLTTFPERIDSVWITISCLMNQTVVPRRIILWLASDQFADRRLPHKIIALQKQGLEIRYCDDLKSHKKYYYAMHENPEVNVITFDDDVFYPSWTVEKLIKKHEQFPMAIVCNWAHRITFERDKIAPYEKWEKGVGGYNEKPTHELAQIGYEGVLYPKNCLDIRVFDKTKIFEIAPTADDLWLKAMAYLHRTKVVRTDENRIPFFTILSTQDSGLTKVNNGMKKNDDTIAKLEILIRKQKKNE